MQLWHRGLLSGSFQFQEEIASGSTVDGDYGIDTDISGTTETLDEDGVIVPEVNINLSYNPLQRSDNSGVDIYTQVKGYITII